MAISKITGSALGKDVIMKDVATADGSSPTLTLQTGDTNIEADDVLGTINFQAPDEGTGTDAILVAAGIAAVSEGDFSSSNNATKLSFRTGASETATEKMTISSTGATTITTADNNPQLILVCTDTDASTGPKLELNRNPGEAGADGDNLGQIEFYGYNDASQKSQYAYIFAEAADVADGSEDVRFGIGGLVAGADSSLMTFMHGTSATGADPEMVFNDTSRDINFRVESDNDANAFFVQGSDGNVGIGTSSPSEKLVLANSSNEIKFGLDGSSHDIFSNGKTFNIGTTDATVLRLFENNAEVMRLSGGNVGIGIAAPLRQLHIFNTSANSEIAFTAATNGVSSILFGDGQTGTDVYRGYVQYQHADNALLLAANAIEHFRIAANGDLTATDTSIASNSDERLKENIADYAYDIAKFKQYEPKTFDWKNADAHNGKTGNRGFLAQAVKTIDDKWVGEANVSEDSLDYDIISDNVSLTSKLGDKDAMYISVIQQLIAKIETLETKVAALEDA